MQTALLSVSGPAELVDAINSAGASFNPSVAREDYNTNRDLWTLYMDLLELDGNRLKRLIDQHEGEVNEKFAARQKAAVAFNLIPSIINMIRGYLFGTEPEVSGVDEDEDLQSFWKDCDGRGTPFLEFVRNQALPMALAMGYVDCLVQNPFTTPPGGSVAAAKELGFKPAAFAITPLDRMNWSAKPGGTYNYITFRDADNEYPNPLVRYVGVRTSYVTVSAAYPELGVGVAADRGFWVRSVSAVQQPMAGVSTTPGDVRWQHEAAYTPTARVPISTLYYQQSNDPKGPKHMGVSKIAMMAVITRAIIQVLSWTMEDTRANLALLSLPARGGVAPQKEDGTVVTPTLTPFTILWYDPENSGQPKWLNGDVAHIKIKMDLVTAYVNEIYRLANLLGVSGAAETITSGVQGLVARNELFQELQGLATGLDRFALETLALVKSWATNTDVGVADLPDVKVSFFKGPYTYEPLADVLDNSAKAVELLKNVSPKGVEAVLLQATRSLLYADDPLMRDTLDEIKRNTSGAVQLFTADPLGVAAAAAQGGASGAGGVPAETGLPGGTGG